MAKRGFCILFLATLSSVPAVAATESVSESEFRTYQELAQTRFDAAQASASKDLQILQTQLDSQDKRSDDLQSHIGDIGLYLALYGILITLAAAALGLIGYFSVRSRAREEARIESKKWFNEQAHSLTEQISGFEQQLAAQKEKLDQQADRHCIEMQKTTATVKNLAKEQIQILQDNLARPPSESTPGSVITATPAAQALDEIANQLRNKPESEYSFSDWDNRAFAAMQANQLEDAAFFWQRAIDIHSAKPIDIAHALFNKGVVLSKLGRNEAALATYDEILERFGNSTELKLRKQVARALINKGLPLSKLGRSEDAITTYDEVLKRFGEATELTLREPVARALINKGAVLNELKRSNAAIDVYDAMLARFSDTAEPILREQIARAMINKGIALHALERRADAIAIYDDVLARFGNAIEPELIELVTSANNSKGFTLLCYAKTQWQDTPTRTAKLEAALGCFNSALEEANNPGVRAVILGNLAYAKTLSGKPREEVHDELHQALTLGCATLYQATLKDLEISPVPEDTNFRVLLDTVWAKVKSSCEEHEKT